MKSVLNISIFAIFALVGCLSVEQAIADGLVKKCGSYSVDYSKMEFSVSGRNYLSLVEDYSSGQEGFHLRLSPAEGLSKLEAHRQAVLSTGIICMQLDSSIDEVGEGRLIDGAWLFTSSCSGHKVRLEAKC
jgi:hypothetical protein